jgi:hypothetical protein
MVPIGALGTAAILGMGIRAFSRGNQIQSQKFMRLRVIAQGLTVVAIVTSASFGFVPHDRPATFEEKMERNGSK